jgi:AbrB family looped-hinge helix DNA binding protein
MRITSKGQVTIPQHVREKLGLHPQTEVEFVVERGRAYLRKRKGGADRAAELVRHLREKGAGKLRMSSKELLALLRDEPDELDAD